MTEKTDIKALRSEAANIIGLLTAEGHQSFALDKVADFFDDVFRLLEAERQRADDYKNKFIDWKGIADAAGDDALAQTDRAEKAEAELAALRGEQEPAGYVMCNHGIPDIDFVFADEDSAIGSAEHLNHPDGKDEWTVIPIFTRQPKPVVVLSDCDIAAVSHMAHWYSEKQCEAWVAGVEHAKKQMLAAGITVNGGKDG